MHYFKYFLPTTTLMIGLALSSIAGYYSVLGLSTIFGGAMVGFIFMELAKVSCTLLLHKHWNDGFGLVSKALTASVVILAIITSMGTFGYLSKASSDRSSDVEVNSSKMLFLESGIAREQERLKQNLNQIDTYNQTISKLITDNPTKASSERRRLQKDITTLSEENKKISESIDKLSKELIPYKVEISKHEVEIGPLIYITKMIYGDEYAKHSSTVLSYLIIIIVLVFDPLAIMLLIASQKSFDVISGKTIKPIIEQEPKEVEQAKSDDDDPPIGEVVIPRNKVRANQM